MGDAKKTIRDVFPDNTTWKRALSSPRVAENHGDRFSVFQKKSKSNFECILTLKQLKQIVNIKIMVGLQ